MYAVERQRWLVDRARTVRRIDVNDVAQLLEVAPETVRRDLNILGLPHLPNPWAKAVTVSAQKPINRLPNIPGHSLNKPAVATDR